jgi:hypothetical protein
VGVAVGVAVDVAVDVAVGEYIHVLLIPAYTYIYQPTVPTLTK